MINKSFCNNFYATLAAACMLSYELFFIICALVGYIYPGSTNSYVYKGYIGVLFAISVATYLQNIYRGGAKEFIRLDVKFLMIPVLVVVAYVSSIIHRGGVNKTAELFLIYFFIFNLPALLMGSLIGRLGLTALFIKILNFLVVIASLAILKSYILEYFLGFRFESFGGVDYQSTSYIAALFFGLNIYFLIFRGESRSDYLRIILATTLVFGVLIPGGRGGFLLLVAFLTFFIIAGIYIYLKKLCSRKKLYILMAIIFIAGLSIFGFNKLDSGGEGLKRATEYLRNQEQNNVAYNPIAIKDVVKSIAKEPDLSTKEDAEKSINILDAANAIYAPIHPWLKKTGINWSGTSNRGAIYSNTIRLILEKPIFGYGIFGFWDVSGYPHNIELEILLQGGILYFIAAVIFFYCFSWRLYKLINLDSKNLIILVIFMLPFIRLHVSGTYLSEATLWFCVGLIFSMQIPKTSKAV